MATSKENKKPRNDQEFLALARRRFDLASEAEAEVRKESLDDLKFVAGEQWPAEIKTAREQDGRPCLTINLIAPSVRQVVNDQRQNRPSIQVNPTDDQATKDTAEVIQGLIRHIEYDSSADFAYDTASAYQARMGFGYLRVITGYCDSKSFDRDIKIKRIRNPFTIYLDPSAQEPDGSDANWGFVFDEITKDEFKSKYKSAELSQMQDWKSIGDGSDGWVTEDGCRVAEYFYKEFEPDKLYLLSDGSSVLKSELPKDKDGEIALPQNIEILDERDTVVPHVKWAKINGIDVLEETDFDSKYIPIIPVYGEEYVIEGKRILEGLVRGSKDPQRQYNFMSSAAAEAIALAPKAPFVGAEGQFEGHELEWRDANRRNYAYLEYKATNVDGKMLPPPQRNNVEPPIQAITQARVAAANDVKSTTGVFDPTLGNNPHDQSGKALERQNQQSQTGNFHLSDNFTRALKHVGRIVLELIPSTYDTKRAVRIIKPDGEQQVVAINQLFEENGKQKMHDFSVGKYDVTVSTGPSYQTKRQEAAASMISLSGKLPPQQVAAIAPLMVKAMDWPMATEVAEQLNKTLPPQLQSTKDGQPQIPPQALQQMQQMQATIHDLSGKFAAADNMLKNKMLETASKERVEMAKLKADIEVELAKMGAKSAETMLEHQVGQIQRREDQLNDQLQQQNQNPSGGEMPSGPAQPVQNSTMGSNP